MKSAAPPKTSSGTASPQRPMAAVAWCASTAATRAPSATAGQVRAGTRVAGAPCSSPVLVITARPGLPGPGPYTDPTADPETRTVVQGRGGAECRAPAASLGNAPQAGCATRAQFRAGNNTNASGTAPARRA